MAHGGADAGLAAARAEEVGSQVGFSLGRRIGDRVREGAERLAGIALIAIAGLLLSGTQIHLHENQAAANAGAHEYSRSKPPRRMRQRTVVPPVTGSDLAIGVLKPRLRCGRDSL